MASGRQTRRLLLAALVVGAGVPACNLVAGIETISVIDGGVDTGSSGKTDAAPRKHDGGRDAAHDARVDVIAHDAGRDAPADAHVQVTADAGADGPPCNANASPHDDPCVLTEAYGVFVAPAAYGGSDVFGTGSRIAPYLTVGKGVAEAGSRRVYVCASGAAPYQETVTVTGFASSVSVYGGLTCPIPLGDGWAYSGTLAAVAPSASGYALAVERMTQPVHFEDMQFTSEAPSPDAGGSASSIAVFVTGSPDVSFTRVTAIAGNGAPGASGAPATNNWCAVVPQSGNLPLGGLCKCNDGTSSTGGTGGNAGDVGESGYSSPPATTTTNGGVLNSNGGNGGNGYGGGIGPPASAAGGLPGALIAASWTPGAGATGADGNPGQGGGGGAGVNSVEGCGGGSGGCGGGGGGGGLGGGASIAVMMVGSGLTFASVTLETGNGGAGGAGMAGQLGQLGGSGITVTGGFSAGGMGGAGGAGWAAAVGRAAPRSILSVARRGARSRSTACPTS